MNRRSFLQIAVPLGIAGIAVAQEEKKGKVDRLSGYVEGIDKNNHTIEMHTRAATTIKRKIMYDDSTKVISSNKPGSIDDVKEGMRIVAIGKFEGVDLKATNISVRPR